MRSSLQIGIVRRDGVKRQEAMMNAPENQENMETAGLGWLASLPAAVPLWLMILPLSPPDAYVAA
jgi:hypothetical protein